MPLDDDDNPFLTPSPAPVPLAGKGIANANNGDPDGHDNEDDPADAPFDMALFASMFSKKGVSSQTIRKGQKDFEAHGTRAQDAALETSRRVIEDVLAYTRLHTGDWNRGWLFADYWPDALAELATARPEFVAALDPALHAADRVVVLEELKGPQNRSVGRTVRGMKPPSPAVGKVWLLPEEALFMLERGSLDLWWPDRTLEDLMPGLAIKRSRGAMTGSKTTAQRGDDNHSGRPADGEPERIEKKRRRTTTTTSSPMAFPSACKQPMRFSSASRASAERSRCRNTRSTHTSREAVTTSSGRPRAETATQAAPSPASTQPKSVWQWLFSLFEPTGSGAARGLPFGPPRPARASTENTPPKYKKARIHPFASTPARRRLIQRAEDPFKVFFHVWRRPSTQSSPKAIRHRPTCASPSSTPGTRSFRSWSSSKLCSTRRPMTPQTRRSRRRGASTRASNTAIATCSSPSSTAASSILCDSARPPSPTRSCTSASTCRTAAEVGRGAEAAAEEEVGAVVDVVGDEAREHPHELRLQPGRAAAVCRCSWRHAA
ncbi:conserved hypothetical protein [Verticillium alfalfae VaMs.102]|uniref:tRNA-splicing endonuclease subunit Sen54 N-terminal domain-containing protein n=1 Tax=Verticillium alfalfae (strain VaMs.102 / ATCC MYA-4576 / FGSC 10136) TaxID=526221 RepID=C9SKP6_VERA1|nr:conserved hypothetical protein [Verticillium alfalfae VaMs.102]EEY19264.1 conserved hypothetical protein [Verticillium alfalfae VaMs.102]